MALIAVTSKKIEANRRNAQKSTGPQTDAGKGRSSRNAATHGCTSSHIFEPLRNEDAEHFENLRQGFINSWKPANEMETRLVEAIAATWIRVERSERWGSSVLTGVIETRQRVAKKPVKPTDKEDLACCTAMIDNDGIQMWDRVERHRSSAWRDFNRSIDQLRRMQNFRLQQLDGQLDITTEQHNQVFTEPEQISDLREAAATEPHRVHGEPPPKSAGPLAAPVDQFRCAGLNTTTGSTMEPRAVPGVISETTEIDAGISVTETDSTFRKDT